jgi:hypothetical protein
MKIKVITAGILCICASFLFADGIDQLNMGIGEDNVFERVARRMKEWFGEFF